MPQISIFPRKAFASGRSTTLTRKLLPAPLLLLFALFSTAACNILGPEEREVEEPDPQDLKILFIGASYLDVNDLPGIFGELAEAAGKEVFVGRRIRSGYYLDFFAQDGVTARAIRSRDWDYVVLSGGCQTAGYPDTHHLINEGWGHHDPYPALQEIKRQVTENHPETVLVYMMPWAFEDGMTWIEGQSDDYFAMQEKIKSNALAWARSLDLVVAPVGMAWNEVMRGDVPEHYLHVQDWNHPAPRGSYLSAATIFSTVFQQSAETADYSWVLNQAEAEDLRHVASETVLRDMALWNITP